jgi:hypothetical protein
LPLPPPHTPKHIRGGWSQYADTSKPVDGYGANDNMVAVQSGFRTNDLSITGPTLLNQLDYRAHGVRRKVRWNRSIAS